MKLYNEMCRRFPELREKMEADAALPYLLMGHLAEWLADMSSQDLTPDLVSRLTAFARRCEEQPRTEHAATDLCTILCVGFYEHLFRAEATRDLLPKLMRREDILNNAEYLKTWVGEVDYNKVLAQYDASA